ncbi:MAG TPA: zf-HC2 domain-containing protein [Longimicrobium sp.]|nr:zf-HC2 domain-containing protein [Longimicrobium sp.]
MTHDQTLELLDDYVGGELPPREERDVRRHLMQCEECRAEETVLRMLLDEAAALPEEIAPERDLWQSIAPRLEARAPVPASPAERLDEVRVIGPRPVRPLPWWMLAAASVALVVTTSFATLRFADNGDADTPVLPAQQAQAPAGADGGTPATLVRFAPAEQEYEKAIGDLQAVLAQHRARLAPETVTVLEANLRIIDQAIRESRAALARDPESPELTRMLTDAYGAKLNVLRRAVSL